MLNANGVEASVWYPFHQGKPGVDGVSAEGSDEELSLSPTDRRVLVVDDNDDGAQMLAEVLHRRGYQTRTACDGEEALEVVRAFRPVLVFLDIMLPDMDGYEVARQLRADSDLVGVVLVALTGRVSIDDKRRAEEAGFDAYLTKPIEFEAIDEVLRGLLAVSRHWRQRESSCSS